MSTTDRHSADDHAGSPSVPPNVEQSAPAGGPANGELTFKVTGMMCAGCAASVQGALESRPGVTGASVSVTSGRATVTGEDLDPDDLVRAIAGRGFTAEPLLGGASAQEMRSEIELRQQANERAWRFRAIVGLSIWAPMETLHWTAHGLGWHGAWITWVMLVGSSIVLAVAGGGFYRSAWSALKKGTTNMDTLISMGATTAYVFSLVVLIMKWLGVESLPPMYFAESSALLGIISLGHWIEARATAKAGSAVRDLLELQPDEAEILEEGAASEAATRAISSADVEPGMAILIRPGGRAPVDGEVIEGESEVDESVVTGEPLPVHKQVGDAIVAGSVNTTGRLVVRAAVDGRHTTVSRIADMVQKAQSSKAEIQRLADRICAIFVPTVITIATVTLLGWLLAGQPVVGIISAVTVLIISCPCALGLATPMAVMVGTGAASRQGILVKSASVLERAGKAKHIVFDKTGTLTKGEPAVEQVIVESSEFSEGDVLSFAAAAESPSEHPIARAIVRAAEARDLAVPRVDAFEAIPGRGVRGTVSGRMVEVRRDEAATCQVLVDGRKVASISVADELRPDAAAAVRRLKEMGVSVTMLTGDRRHVAEAIGRQVGLEPDEIIADATPESKSQYIASLGRGSAMIGDGINDAAALAEADLGIAMASGTNVAIESADVVIPGERIMAVPQTIGLARRSLTTIKQNLVFAFMYNVSAIPLAAFGMLGERGPLVAALAMAASDLMVVGNALRLKFTLGRTPPDEL